MPRAKRLPPPKPPEITNEVIKNAFSEINKAKLIIEKNQKLIYDQESLIKIELVKNMKDVDPDYVELGGWTCMKSPTGSCFYNMEDDPCCDECLVCGDPEERK